MSSGKPHHSAQLFIHSFIYSFHATSPGFSSVLQYAQADGSALAELLGWLAEQRTRVHIGNARDIAWTVAVLSAVATRDCLRRHPDDSDRGSVVSAADYISIQGQEPEEKLDGILIKMGGDPPRLVQLKYLP